MIYGSVCSGIEAATVAWHHLGWATAWFAEIEPFPSAVLRHHYPEVPNHGDFTKLTASNCSPIDLLVGGTPCQSFSVAGQRAGLDDPRGVLAFEFLALCARLRPRWFVFENVPGLLSSSRGEDFAAWLREAVKLGYGVCWRILDAQHFGVPQRRRRVFVVGHLGDWKRAAEVLFEPESLRGDLAARGEKGEEVAGTLAPGAHPGGFNGRDAERNQLVVARTLGGGPGNRSPHTFQNTGQGWWNETNVAQALRTPCGGDSTKANLVAFGGNNTNGPVAKATACNAKGGSGQMDFETETFVTHSLRGEGFDASEDGTGRGTPLVPVAFQERTRKDSRNLEYQEDLAYALMNPGNGSRTQERNILIPQLGVRRLTPRECERLQGFPDDYTLIPVGRKPAADGPRYKALGNSMAVPVMAWIGRRIAVIEGES